MAELLRKTIEKVQKIMDKEQQNQTQEMTEPLQIYLNEIGQLPLLSEEEEKKAHRAMKTQERSFRKRI